FSGFFVYATATNCPGVFRIYANGYFGDLRLSANSSGDVNGTLRLDGYSMESTKGTCSGSQINFKRQQSKTDVQGNDPAWNQFEVASAIIRSHETKEGYMCNKTIFIIAVSTVLCSVLVTIEGAATPVQSKVTEISLSIPESIPYPGCGSSSFTQVPGLSRIFIGRQLFADGKCPQPGITRSLFIHLVQFDFDWEKKIFSQTKKLIEPGDVIADGHRIIAAYDPSAAFFNGEYWIAFECALAEVRVVSACVGPWTPKRGIDKQRTYAVVNGGAVTRDIIYRSASVPKLLVHRNRFYLYWTAVKMQRAEDDPEKRIWFDHTTRGMRIFVGEDGHGRKRVFPWNRMSAVDAGDPNVSVEVLGTEMSPTSNVVADAFDVKSDGKYVYMTAGIGGGDCLVQGGSGINLRAQTPGCYRLAVFASRHPLIFKGFNYNKIENPVTYGNRQSYVRLIKNRNGRSYFLGQFASPEDYVPTSNATLLSRGLKIYKVPEWNVLFPEVRSPETPRTCDLARIADASKNSMAKLTYAFCLVLGRVPSADNQSWRALINEVAPAEAVLRLLASEEFKVKYSDHLQTGRDYVTLLFQLFLDRDPPKSALDQLLAEIRSRRMTREQIDSIVLLSNESRRKNKFLFEP
ncbi:MAG: DUF4214 domain-containing protein, partial [Bdellovibrionales bacterium]